jgi:hypothetical protein
MSASRACNFSILEVAVERVKVQGGVAILVRLGDPW